MDLQQGIKPCFSSSLLDWYHKHHRPLVFRLKKDAYSIWISEIMAQQTRIEAMLPYYERWMQELPDIESVANCEDEKLHKLWQGLGYYSRCRNIKKCALVCMEQYDGKLPNTKQALLKLPGIGPYTAGAIASIAYDERVSAVDGNVIRVFTRLYDIHEDVTKTKVKKYIEQLVDASLPLKDVAYYNQALMELGALICIPKNPRCDICPIREYCQTKEPQLLPKKPEKKPRKIEYKHLYILVNRDTIHLQKRGSSGLLSNLYEFDEVCPEHVKEYIELKPYIHIFSHIEWHMQATLCFMEEESYIPIDEVIQDYALPSAFMPFFDQVLHILEERKLWKKS